jgi:hypothetical protein
VQKRPGTNVLRVPQCVQDPEGVRGAGGGSGRGRGGAVLSLRTCLPSRVFCLDSTTTAASACPCLCIRTHTHMHNIYVCMHVSMYVSMYACMYVFYIRVTS